MCEDLEGVSGAGSAEMKWVSTKVNPKCMTMIDKLTPEQEARIPECREEWRSHGLSTEPANFDAAEEAIKDAYQVAGLEHPKLFIRLRSPLEGAIGAVILNNTKFDSTHVMDHVWAHVRSHVWAHVMDQIWDQVKAQVGPHVSAQVGDQVGDQVGTHVMDQVWAQVKAQVGGKVLSQVRSQVGDQVLAQVSDHVGDQVLAQVWDQVMDQVLAQVGDQIWAHVRDQVGDQVWAQARVAFFSQHEAGYLSELSFFHQVLNTRGADNIEPLARIAASCGWVWFFSGAVIITDRPNILKRDGSNRLHCENGPALAYRDGFSVYAWHGTRIPSEWVENRGAIDPSIILKADNVEKRAARRVAD